jgi:predicted nucleic acid-binding protein
VIREQPIGDFDLIIALIAPSHDEPLATRNIEHFGRVPGLKVEL